MSKANVLHAFELHQYYQTGADLTNHILQFGCNAQRMHFAEGYQVV